MPLSLFTDHWGVVPARIGSVQGRFILDTGTDHTMVDIGLAHRAGWKLSDCKSLPGTAAGNMCRVELPAAKLEGRVLPPVSGRASDMRQSDLGQMTDVDGWIGGDWLKRFVVVFDYPNARWNLIDPSRFVAPPNAESIPFEMADTIILFPVKLNGQSAQLVLDTGTAGSALLFNVPGQEKMSSANESRHVYRNALHIAGGGDGDLVEGHALLEMGNIRWPDAAVRIVPHGTGSGYVMEHLAGTIGAESLHPFRVTIDYPRQRLYLEQLLPFPTQRARATWGIMAQPHAGKLVVASVAEGHPAALAGIVAGDEILAIGGVPVTRANLAVMKWALVARSVGERIVLGLSRGDVTLVAVESK